MCFSSKPPGPTAEQRKLQQEQIAGIEREKKAAENEKERIAGLEVKDEIRRRRSGGITTPSMFGSGSGGFGTVGGGSFFKARN